MKNVIKNQKLFFISLIGIIVVSSILIYTYAYQSLQVVYKSGSKEKLTVNAGVLDVTFAVTNRLNITSMPLLSSYKSAEYSEFTISNTKSSDDAAYKVSITDITYTSNLVSSDFNYTLVNADTNEIVSEDNFSNLTGTSIELTDFITLKKNNSVKLRLYLWLKETTSNQNSLENASFKGKIEITSMFDKEVPKKLVDTILTSAETATTNSDATRTIYQETPTTTPGQAVSTETEKTLSKTQDDYGDSYYFRGNVVDNFVNYAGMCWRIVRIEGDGSIKLILASELSCSDTNVTTTSGYATDGAVGVQGTKLTAIYGYKKVEKYYEDDYINSFANTTENVRTKLNTWLQTKITKDSDKALLKNDNWCIGDRITFYDSSYNLISSTKTIGELINTNIPFYYSTNKRFKKDNAPTLKCDGSNERDGEVDKNTIGMLTADETLFAGSSFDSKNFFNNSTYYLNKNATSNDWWVLSLSDFYLTAGGLFSYAMSSTGILNNGSIFRYDGFYSVGGSLAFRATVTLVPSTQITSGDGTVNNAYVVKTS